MRTLRFLVEAKSTSQHELQRALEVGAFILAWVAVAQARCPVQHGFVERGRVGRDHGSAAGLRLDDVQAQRLLLGQTGQQEVDGSVYRADVPLMSPKAHSFAQRAKRPGEITHRRITATAENLELHRRIAGEDRGEVREEQRKL